MKPSKPAEKDQEGCLLREKAAPTFTELKQGGHELAAGHKAARRAPTTRPVPHHTLCAEAGGRGDRAPPVLRSLKSSLTFRGGRTSWISYVKVNTRAY